MATSGRQGTRVRFEESADRAAASAADLVNEAMAGPLDAPALARVWPATRACPNMPDEGTLERLQRLAGRLHMVFRSAEAPELVNGMLARLRVTPHLVEHDDVGPHLHFERADADLVERFETNVLMGLAVLACDENQRLGTCAAEGCDRAWVDTSRNASRRFCSSSCANRTHVAAHRARRRARG